MKKYSPNQPCPCGSGHKYKKCCQPYHKGAIPKDALTLMKSRYSAYAVGESRYIITTTHPNNPDYRDDQMGWRAEIDLVCQQTEFLGLEIREYVQGDRESFVTFCARLGSGNMVERSRFFCVKGKWFYMNGEMV